MVVLADPFPCHCGEEAESGVHTSAPDLGLPRHQSLWSQGHSRQHVPLPSVPSSQHPQIFSFPSQVVNEAEHEAEHFWVLLSKWDKKTTATPNFMPLSENSPSPIRSCVHSVVQEHGGLVPSRSREASRTCSQHSEGPRRSSSCSSHLCPRLLWIPGTDPVGEPGSLLERQQTEFTVSVPQEARKGDISGGWVQGQPHRCHENLGF